MTNISASFIKLNVYLNIYQYISKIHVLSVNIIRNLMFMLVYMH